MTTPTPAVDPVVVRLLVLLLLLVGIAAWPDNGAGATQRSTAGARPIGHPEGQLARQGCLDGRTALVEDYRAIPGMRRVVAERLEAHCHTGHCAPDAVPDIAGVGPVLRGRLAKLFCKKPPRSSGFVELERVVQNPHRGLGEPRVDHHRNFDL